jgi:predicted metalloprotease
MLVRWLPLVCAALLLSGCGSSGDSGAARSPTASPAGETATPTAAATATADSGELRRLPDAPGPSGAPPSSASRSHEQFLTAVFVDAQRLWERVFDAAGLTYRPARLTIFGREIDTACGMQAAGAGPFYCPASKGVYIDPSFFSALSAHVRVRLGEFAQAYVVAHEMGHHVQFLLGIIHATAAADEADPAGENARSVRVELQADCFAGVWAHSAYRRGDLTDDDLADALRAAAVVGDDFLQHRATGTVRPEAFTHGTSAQRQDWLKTGFVHGSPAACDTFSNDPTGGP